MSKYDPLWSWIGKTDKDSLKLSFEEAEKILGFPIDHSFLRFKKELSGYGWEVQKISLKQQTILFHRLMTQNQSSAAASGN
ncbi:hypothetical protein [uncultured Faecalibaculum sp.]|uniref:hypothetical protein n=1 Tax=uncultured Faecalibaculum sp. TaxID=1729681 RepID=UPI0025F9468B|nr:hypothetical protein [uncultured Faecalibaculum sp.]